MSLTEWIKSTFLFVTMIALFTFPLTFLAAIFYPPLWELVIIQAVFLMVGLRKA